MGIIICSVDITVAVTLTLFWVGLLLVQVLRVLNRPEGNTTTLFVLGNMKHIHKKAQKLSHTGFEHIYKVCNTYFCTLINGWILARPSQYNMYHDTWVIIPLYHDILWYYTNCDIQQFTKRVRTKLKCKLVCTVCMVLMKPITLIIQHDSELLSWHFNTLNQWTPKTLTELKCKQIRNRVHMHTNSPYHQWTDWFRRKNTVTVLLKNIKWIVSVMLINCKYTIVQLECYLHVSTIL